MAYRCICGEGTWCDGSCQAPEDVWVDDVAIVDDEINYDPWESEEEAEYEDEEDLIRQLEEEDAEDQGEGPDSI